MADIGEYRAPAEINHLRTLALGIGGIGLIAWAVGFYFDPEQALRSWLLGFIFWAGIGIGSLGILILQYLTGGACAMPLQPFGESRRPTRLRSNTVKAKRRYFRNRFRPRK